VNFQPTDDTDRQAGETSPLSLEISGVSKSFGRFPALKNVSLQAKDKEFLALLGPSGSGKTTLLRVLAGLERPEAGEVRFAGEDFLALPVRRRKVGMVFQHYALFRHMTVAQNIAFGLTVRPRAERPAKSVVADRVADLLSLVQLEDLGARFPAQLSGGQRQRVALARALAIDRAGVTTVFVTHDQEEALDLADRVAILKDGELRQFGAPNEIYENPADPFVYDFLGAACRLPGTVEGTRLTVADWETTAPEGAPQGRVEMFFRPNQVIFAPQDGAGLAAEVRAVAARGPDVRIECLIEGRVFELEARGPGIPGGVAPGLSLRIKPMLPKVYAAKDA
jgi:sulfate transport system ATP-binding protein